MSELLLQTSILRVGKILGVTSDWEGWKVKKDIFSEIYQEKSFTYRVVTTSLEMEL